MTNQDKLNILTPKMESMIGYLEKAANAYQEMKKEVAEWPAASKDEEEPSIVNEWTLRIAEAYKNLEID